MVHEVIDVALAAHGSPRFFVLEQLTNYETGVDRSENCLPSEFRPDFPLPLP